jgi:hypothetical protein
MLTSEGTADENYHLISIRKLTIIELSKSETQTFSRQQPNKWDSHCFVLAKINK